MSTPTCKHERQTVVSREVYCLDCSGNLGPLTERDSLKSENDQLRGVLSLILIYPNVGKHLGSELINLAHAALGTKETQQP